MTRADLAMNPAYQGLLSERSSLERMIADTPPDDVIDLRSLQARLEIVNDQLAAQPKKTRLVKGESEMSDAPTPETDKAEDSDPMVEGEWHWIVPSSFARRLERERDEARRERDDALDQKNLAFNSIRSAWSLLDHSMKEEA